MIIYKTFIFYEKLSKHFLIFYFILLANDIIKQKYMYIYIYIEYYKLWKTTRTLTWFIKKTNERNSRSKGLLVSDCLYIVSAKGTRPDPTETTCYQLHSHFTIYFIRVYMYVYNFQTHCIPCICMQCHTNLY